LPPFFNILENRKQKSHWGHSLFHYVFTFKRHCCKSVQNSYNHKFSPFISLNIYSVAKSFKKLELCLCFLECADSLPNSAWENRQNSIWLQASFGYNLPTWMKTIIQQMSFLRVGYISNTTAVKLFWFHILTLWRLTTPIEVVPHR